LATGSGTAVRLPSRRVYPWSPRVGKCSGNHRRAGTQISPNISGYLLPLTPRCTDKYYKIQTKGCKTAALFFVTWRIWLICNGIIEATGAPVSRSGVHARRRQAAGARSVSLLRSYKCSILR